MLVFLADQRKKDEIRKKKNSVAERNKVIAKVQSNEHLFLPDFIPGKGTKHAGFGALFIGGHYRKQAELDEQKHESKKNQKWLEDYWIRRA